MQRFDGDTCKLGKLVDLVKPVQTGPPEYREA